MAKSTNAASRMSQPTMFEDSSNAISSLGSGVGPTRSDSPAGLMTDQSGPAPVPANRGAWRGSARVATIPAIFGRRGAGSYGSAVLRESLVSRLIQRLEGCGSILFTTTWSTRDMPSGRLVYRLVPSGRRTLGPGYGSLPTPTARDYRWGMSEKAIRARRVHSRGVNLNEFMQRELGEPGRLNPLFLCLLMGYPAEWQQHAATAMRLSRRLPRK